MVRWSAPVRPTAMPFAKRRGIAFVGGYGHPPNLDAARWLISEIMPQVRERDPKIECLLVGDGLPDGVRFHDLRHTCAALLLAQGASLEQVKKLLGHSTIRVTSDRYGHLYDGHDDDLLDRLDRTGRGAVQPVTEAGRVMPFTGDASRGIG